MFVSMFDVIVRNVAINDLSTNLQLSDKNGNNVTLFFNSPDEVRDFSKQIRRAVMDESEKKWNEFERPTLITD